jgi:DNA-binding CsgD family transcriptional regulator
MQPRSLHIDELQVLRLVAKGKSTDEIAEMLGIHKSVVQDRIRVAVRKLGAANRTHAAVIASELGLLKSIRQLEQSWRQHELTRPPMADDEREQRVRQRAYFIWVQDGKPHGHDEEHWLLAEAEEKAQPGGDREPLPNPFDPNDT